MKTYYFEEITSTNEIAKEIARKGERNFTVIADKQKQGKGRLKRKWCSPLGGLYLSLVFEKNPMMSLIASISVVNALKHFGLNPRIKWPNDILIKNKKVAGILIECSGDYAVVGIGINLAKKPKIKGATSIKAQLGKDICREVLVEKILKEFEKCFGKSLSILDEYKKLSDTIGKFVKIKMQKGDIEGKAIGIDEQGRLLVEENKELKKIFSGDCIYLR
jgi:BirA family biotin operon repressor/biotin-[acetyl-CoA-carboxylase] ligase